jgi:hypothetical protein
MTGCCHYHDILAVTISQVDEGGGEEVYDGNRLTKLIDDASENNTLKRVIANGAYDN